MLFNRSYQDEILQGISDNKDKVTSMILSDIVNEFAGRRDEIIGLYNRSILQEADESYTQGGTNNDGKFKRSIEYSGIPIYNLVLANQNNVNKPVHHDFLGTIKDNFQDYMTGNPVMTVYKSDNDNDNEEYTELFTRWGRVESIQGKYSKVSGDDALSGVGYMLLHQDGEDVHIKALQPYEAIVIYDTNGDAQYAMRVWDDKEKTISDNNVTTVENVVYVEWYDKENVYFFKAKGTASSTTQLTFESYSRNINGKEVVSIPHMMGDVPIVELPKDDTRLGDVERSLDLQDLYDLLDTGLNNELLQQAMSYIVFQGAGVAIDQELKNNMIQNGIISIDKDGKVYFLEKNLSDEALSNSMERVRKAIFDNSNSIDYATMDSDTRIMGLEQKLKKIDASVTKTIKAWQDGLRRMWTMVVGYWNRFEGTSIDPELIETIFTRNRPQDVWAEIKLFTESGGQISNETKLEQLSFVQDAKKEKERIEAEFEESPFVKDEADIRVQQGDQVDDDLPSGLDVDKDIVLNGAQIKSALDIVRAVKTGEISQNEGLNMIEIFFNITPDKARRILSSANV